MRAMTDILRGIGVDAAFVDMVAAFADAAMVPAAPNVAAPAAVPAVPKVPKVPKVVTPKAPAAPKIPVAPKPDAAPKPAPQTANVQKLTAQQSHQLYGKPFPIPKVDHLPKSLYGNNWRHGDSYHLNSAKATVADHGGPEGYKSYLQSIPGPDGKYRGPNKLVFDPRTAQGNVVDSKGNIVYSIAMTAIPASAGIWQGYDQSRVDQVNKEDLAFRGGRPDDTQNLSVDQFEQGGRWPMARMSLANTLARSSLAEFREYTRDEKGRFAPLQISLDTSKVADAIGRAVTKRLGGADYAKAADAAKAATEKAQKADAARIAAAKSDPDSITHVDAERDAHNANIEAHRAQKAAADLAPNNDARNHHEAQQNQHVKEAHTPSKEPVHQPREKSPLQKAAQKDRQLQSAGERRLAAADAGFGSPTKAIKTLQGHIDSGALTTPEAVEKVVTHLLNSGMTTADLRKVRDGLKVKAKGADRQTLAKNIADAAQGRQYDPKTAPAKSSSSDIFPDMDKVAKKMHGKSVATEEPYVRPLSKAGHAPKAKDEAMTKLPSVFSDAFIRRGRGQSKLSEEQIMRIKNTAEFRRLQAMGVATAWLDAVAEFGGPSVADVVVPAAVKPHAVPKPPPAAPHAKMCRALHSIGVDPAFIAAFDDAYQEPPYANGPPPRGSSPIEIHIYHGGHHGDEVQPPQEQPSVSAPYMPPLVDGMPPDQPPPVPGAAPPLPSPSGPPSPAGGPIPPDMPLSPDAAPMPLPGGPPNPPAVHPAILQAVGVAQQAAATALQHAQIAMQSANKLGCPPPGQNEQLPSLVTRPDRQQNVAMTPPGRVSPAAFAKTPVLAGAVKAPAAIKPVKMPAAKTPKADLAKPIAAKVVAPVAAKPTPAITPKIEVAPYRGIARGIGNLTHAKMSEERRLQLLKKGILGKSVLRDEVVVL